MYYESDDSEQYDWYDESYISGDRQSEDNNEPDEYYDFG